MSKRKHSIKAHSRQCLIFGVNEGLQELTHSDNKKPKRKGRTTKQNRRYYLHRKVKAFVPRLEVKHKQVFCISLEFSEIQKKYINELISSFGYGVQLEF